MLETVDDLREQNRRLKQIIALLECERDRWRQLAHDVVRGVASISETHEAREGQQVALNTDYLSSREAQTRGA
jgi:hypothetical protein